MSLAHDGRELLHHARHVFERRAEFTDIAQLLVQMTEIARIECAAHPIGDTVAFGGNS
jgi:hypothetical protein